MKKIALVLTGCGFKDGTEIRESVAALWALDTENAETHCFAPDKAQFDVVNCLTGETEKSQIRNQLTEAARIARGKIRPLSELNPDLYDCLLLPGGFGAAKNLCSFALNGAKGSVHEELKKIILSMHNSQKPVGAICIAPAILALAITDKNIRLTLGSTSEASVEIEKLGHTHIECKTSDCVVDLKHKIVTTPAYMDDDAALKDVFTGIHKAVRELLALTT